MLLSLVTSKLEKSGIKLDFDLNKFNIRIE